MFLSVSLSSSFTRLWVAKTAERIEVLFGVKTLGNQRNIVLDGGPDPPSARGREVHSMQPLPNHFGLLFARRQKAARDIIIHLNTLKLLTQVICANKCLQILSSE